MSLKTAAAHWTDPTHLPLKGDEPGVRMLAGKPYIFNGTVLGADRSRIAVKTAPASLFGLSDDDLKALERHVSNAAYQRSVHWSVTDPLHARVWVELRARGFNTDGTRDVAPLAKAA